jgi:hypothetical protein
MIFTRLGALRALSQSASPNVVIADIGGCQEIRRGWEGLGRESQRLHETHYSLMSEKACRATREEGRAPPYTGAPTTTLNNSLNNPTGLAFHTTYTIAINP